MHNVDKHSWDIRKKIEQMGYSGMKNKPKYIRWWIFAFVVFAFFVMLQVPAAWLISKFYKNNQILHNVSGNIWQGQADWRQGNLRGSLRWTTRPLDLLLLRAGAQLEIHSGHTHLEGVIGYGFGQKIMLRDFSGQIAPETLQHFAAWQWPNNPIQFEKISLNYQKEKGFYDADGQLQWSGGELTYSFAQRQERMSVPFLKGRLSDQQQRLTVDIHDQREQKMLNLQLDHSLMLDFQVTQRFLMNVPSYKGKAGLDTYVISSRQPLLQGGR